MRTIGMALTLAVLPACAFARTHPGGGPKVKTYDADGRTPIGEIYGSLAGLAKKGRWKIETVFIDQELPIQVLFTKRKGPAVWVLAGIHGEEPAPPDAVHKSLGTLDALAAGKIPVVLFPLCNPAGYSKNWRYPDAEKYDEKNPGHSVGDSDHLLPGKDGRPRAEKASSAQADALTRKALELAKDYPPALSIDLHEDDLIGKGYLYSQGPKGHEDPAAKAIIRKMAELRYPIILSGKTRFDEPIVDGIVSGVQDGSIDELIASEEILAEGAARDGPSGRSVIVVETSAMRRPLKERVDVHCAILGMLEELYSLAVK